MRAQDGDPMFGATITIVDLFATGAPESFAALVCIEDKRGISKQTILQLCIEEDTNRVTQHRMLFPPSAAGWTKAASIDGVSVLLVDDAAAFDIWGPDGLTRNFIMHRGRITDICWRGGTTAVVCTDLGQIVEIDAAGTITEIARCGVHLTAIAANQDRIVASSATGHSFTWEQTTQQFIDVTVEVPVLTSVTLHTSNVAWFGGSDGSVYFGDGASHYLRNVVEEGVSIVGVGSYGSAIWAQGNSIWLSRNAGDKWQRLPAAPWAAVRTLALGNSASHEALFGFSGDKLGYWSDQDNAWIAQRLILGGLAAPYTADSWETWDDWMPCEFVPTSRFQAVDHAARQFDLNRVHVHGTSEASIQITDNWWWWLSAFGLGSLIHRSEDTNELGLVKSFDIYPVRRVFNVHVSGQFRNAMETALMRQPIWEPMDSEIDSDTGSGSASQAIAEEIASGRVFIDEYPRFTVKIATGGAVSFEPASHAPSVDRFNEEVLGEKRIAGRQWRERPYVHTLDFARYHRQIAAICTINSADGMRALSEAAGAFLSQPAR